VEEGGGGLLLGGMLELSPTRPQVPTRNAVDTLYITYKARFHQLAIYSILLLCNAALWVCLASLATQEAPDYFGVGEFVHHI